MASTKFIKRNLQRYRKVYPYIRREPRYVLESEKQALIEVGSIPFSNSSTETYFFIERFSVAPNIASLSVDSESTNNADVNIFIKEVTSAYVTVESSQAFTGAAHFHAIWIAS